MRWIVISFICIGLNSQAQAIENFSLVNVVNDKTVSLEDYTKYDGVVIIFTSTNCPYDGYYMTRIKELAETFKTKTPFLLINSSVEESVDQMRNYVNTQNLTIPYLADKVHNAFSALHPKKSPECFLLKANSGKFVVVYRGAIDDNAQTAAAVNHTYLKDAINKLVGKQKIDLPDVRPPGCSIQID